MEEEVINCAECGFNRKLAVKDIIWDTLKKNFNEDDDIMCAVPNTGLDVTERKEDDKEKTYNEKKAKPNMNKESRFKEKEDFKNERKSNTWKKQSHSELGQVYPYKQETCSF
ncbi:uncharacterized protein LOC134270305 [Saccostrea cucullata]|uniref:uncharacterized protein LOC134270305 n=1 Tax=Saccostrea cuccullata TaxID=36930 RepID=UPI002ED3800E